MNESNTKETTIRMPIKGLELIDNYLSVAPLKWSQSEYLQNAIFNGILADSMFWEMFAKSKLNLENLSFGINWCELYGDSYDIFDFPEKVQLLTKALNKIPQTFIQFDGFMDMFNDTGIPSDSDGDCLMSSKTRDLRWNEEKLPVRIQIHNNAKPDDVIRVLTKLVSWINREYNKPHYGLLR